MAKLKYSGDIVAGAAIEGASYRLGATTIVTAAGVLQNVTVPLSLTTGALPDARLSANVPLLNATENAFTGAMRAASYKLGATVIVTPAGVLQNVTIDPALLPGATTDASALTSGTLADARLSSNIPLKSAVTNVFTGMLDATQFKLNGSVIVTAAGVVQNVSMAATLLTGTLADARLSSNVPLLSAATNTFTGALTASGTITGGAFSTAGTMTATGSITSSRFISSGAGGIADLVDTTAAANNRWWQVLSSGGSMYLRTVNDAGTVAIGALEITRSGTTPTLVNLRVDSGVRFYDSASTLKGGISYDSTGFGFLNSAGGWAVRVNPAASSGTLFSDWTCSGNFTATAFFTSSSRALKRNIAPFTDSALELVRGVRVVRYTYRADETDAPRVGFIAEDTHPLLSSRTQTVMDQANILGVLLKAVQELAARVDGHAGH